jgi:hypothetical protein
MPSDGYNGEGIENRRYAMPRIKDGIQKKVRPPSLKLTISEKDKRKTLQDLDGESWGEVTFPSHVVKECHRLHQTLLCDFRVEDLRLMIGQQIGTPYLLPLAIEQLRINPLAEGDFFPGDLLLSVLRIDRAFWQQYPAWWREVHGILEQLTDAPKELAEAANSFNREPV